MRAQYWKCMKGSFLLSTPSSEEIIKKVISLVLLVEIGEMVGGRTLKELSLGASIGASISSSAKMDTPAPIETLKISNIVPEQCLDG